MKLVLTIKGELINALSPDNRILPDGDYVFIDRLGLKFKVKSESSGDEFLISEYWFSVLSTKE